MPFTLSHPAAAALLRPILRRARLPLSAIAIGAMVPDFEFFRYMTTRSVVSHTFVGLFIFCLPVGMAVLAMWRLILRAPVRDLLGMPATEAIPLSLGWWARGGVAVIVGAATHDVWDGLTHHGRWADAVFPALGNVALAIMNRPVSWFVVLDYASTLVGGLVVLAWLYAELRDTGALTVLARPSWRWLAFGALFVSSLTLGTWNGARGTRLPGVRGAELYVARVAIGAMLALGLGLIVFSLVRLRVKRASTVTPADGLSSLT